MYDSGYSTAKGMLEAEFSWRSILYVQSGRRVCNPVQVMWQGIEIVAQGIGLVDTT